MKIFALNPIREFFPIKDYENKTVVKSWLWSKNTGLKVLYKDGVYCKSAWNTLNEFLLAVKEHREIPIFELEANDLSMKLSEVLYMTETYTTKD
jgi:hypothetical protein